MGCDPEEIELESRRRELSSEEAREAGGCFMVEMLGGPGSGKIVLTALPRTDTSPSGSYEMSGGTKEPEGHFAVGAGSGDCLRLGEFELSIRLNGRTSLRENILVPTAKQSVVLIHAHTLREPRWSVAEVDLSPADPGLRRARITNYIEVVEPIQLFFYDADDEPVGESESIAWGETWTGTIPSAATGYRLSPAQPVTEPFQRAPLSLGDRVATADLPCLDALPVGLVVIGTYQENEAVLHGEHYEWRGTSHVEERYTYLPPLCFSE
jgi:hypothetical protein